METYDKGPALSDMSCSRHLPSLWADWLLEGEQLSFYALVLWCSPLPHARQVGRDQTHVQDKFFLLWSCLSHAFCHSIKNLINKTYSVKNNISIWEIYWEKNLNYVKCTLKKQTTYCKVWSPDVHFINIKLIDFIISYKRRK